MGITGLWEAIGDGEVWSIADYSARHYDRHKRPLRIAVDAACWRFTNLTSQQVQRIREGEPAANPVEKVILWRILRLLKLNIQLIFVDDGMHRPWKRDKCGGNKVGKELVKLTHQLLDHLKVPYHQAPGEAEAECARMQALGVVDAVWSDDCDTLMFGCGTLIKQHKVGKDRVKDHIKVYKAKSIREKYDLDADSLVLFAVLAGGDYNTEGLRGCGPKTAALIARRENGLARTLCHATQNDLPSWRKNFLETLSRHGKSIEIPSTFPDWKALGHYRSPAVSTPEQLSNLRGLRHGWDRPMDQAKLRVILRQRFNFTTREYLKHITPIFLARALARAKPEQKAENLAFGIQLKRTRRKNDVPDDASTKSEVKITFSPMPVVEVDLSQQPPDEDWTKFASKDGTPYDPTQNLEAEILDCFLRHGLPNGTLDMSPQPRNADKRKRKTTDYGCASSPAPKKQKCSSQKTSNESLDPSEETITRTSRDMSHSAIAGSALKKRGRPPKHAPTASGTRKFSISKAKKTSPKRNTSAREESPPPAIFKRPRAMPSFMTTPVYLCEADSDPNWGKAAGGQQSPTRVRDSTSRFGDTDNARSSPNSGDMRVPGEVISSEALRRLRAASSSRKYPLVPRQGGLFSSQLPTVERPRSTDYEVIDLT